MRHEAPVRVLIVGATSAIAAETARQYAAYGARLYLTARDAGLKRIWLPNARLLTSMNSVGGAVP